MKLPKKEKPIKTLTDLYQQGIISKENMADLAEVEQRFNLLLSPTMSNLIEADNPHDPIAKQFLPQIEELNEDDTELDDPIGDGKYEKVKGIVHRYPDRCLLKIVNVCPVYCRFCFRKKMIGPKQPSLTPIELQAAYDYIESQPEIDEVILTGGDPLILKPAKLAAVFSALSSIKQIKVIRIHTRIPVVDPARISSELIAALTSFKTTYVVLHANHPKEMTPAAISACASLIDAGIPLLSQSVLLKGVNDTVEVLSTLMKTFVQHRIKPYYLHHPDLAKGTSHFRVSIEEGRRLVASLQGRLSGLCQPTYMLEVPGGLGKIPIGSSFITKLIDTWQITTHEGYQYEYEESGSMKI